MKTRTGLSAGMVALAVALSVGVAAPSSAVTASPGALPAPSATAPALVPPSLASPAVRKAAAKAAPAAAPAAASDLVKDSNIAAVSEVFTEINTFRAGKGLPAVKFTPKISVVAQAWSDTMGTTANFDHNPSYSSQMPAGWQAASEIIAARSDRDVKELVKLWINSPVHNAIMSTKDYTTIGIGVTFTNSRPESPTQPRWAMYSTVNWGRYASNPDPTFASVQAWQDSLNGGQPTPTPSPTQPPAQNAIRPVGSGDVLARDAGGNLWNYGSPALGGRQLLGTGWDFFKQTFVADWNQDGVQDLIAQANNGDLYLYRGLAGGDYQPGIRIGAGWQAMTVTVGKWNSANPFPSIVAKDAAGDLWYYPNSNGLNFGARVRIGTGWSNLAITQVDFDGNGTMDLLARTTDGKMLLYKGAGSNGFTGGSTVVGSGWNPYSFNSTTGFAGAGTTGVIAKHSSGVLYYYGISAGQWQAARQIGTGFGPYTLAAN